MSQSNQANAALFEDLARRVSLINGTLPSIQKAMLEIQRVFKEIEALQPHVTYVQNALENMGSLVENYEHVQRSAAGSRPTPVATHGNLAQEAPVKSGLSFAASTPDTRIEEPTRAEQPTPRLPLVHGGLPPSEEAHSTKAAKTPQVVLPTLAASDELPELPPRKAASTQLGGILHELESATSSLSRAAQGMRQGARLNTAAQAAVPKAEPEHTPEQLREALSNAFVGNDNMFMQAISPVVHPLGRGLLQPGFAKLDHYQEDVFATDISVAVNWRTGFYTEEATGKTQLFLNTAAGLVLVSPLEPQTIPYIVRLSAQTPSWEPITALSLEEAHNVFKAIQMQVHQLHSVDERLKNSVAQ